DGWGRRFLVVAPDGLVLPCHAAHTLPGLTFDNARTRPLADIWRHSAAFGAFRGEAWMPEPCRSCERRAVDFGGCRCQAYHLTGDAAATDPACSLAPSHALAAAAPLIPLLTATTLVSPIRTLTYEAPLLGWPLTLARFVPGVLLPPVMGLLGQWLFGVFKRWE